MDSKQFKEIVLPHYKAMYWVALRILGDSNDAQDAVQDAVLKLWSTRGSMAGIENMASYTVTMARNVAVDIKRRQHHADSIEIVAEQPQAGREIHKVIDNRDMATKALEMIDSLPPVQREVLLLRDVEGREIDEIVSTTGLTHVNIRQILSRARRFIRQSLERN